MIFESEEFTYDGNEHSLVAKAPEEWEITYEYNNKTYPGTVEVRAIFSHECYNDVEMYATLTVNKAEYTKNNIYVDDVVVEYDGLEHQVEVNVPSGWIVSFSEEGITEVGTYEIIVTLSHNNYLDIVKTATLTITESTPAVSADINKLNTLINTYYNILCFRFCHPPYRKGWGGSSYSNAPMRNMLTSFSVRKRQSPRRRFFLVSPANCTRSRRSTW